MNNSDDLIINGSNMFNKTKSPIFKDEYTLTIEYIPEQLIGRKKQVEKIASLIDPIFRNSKPYSCLIYGKTGSGKTVVVRFVLNTLMKELLTEDLSATFLWIYVPCKQKNTTNEILYYLITQINPHTRISRKGHSLDTYYQELWKEITDKNLSLFIVLDEIDQLKKDDLLYNLSRAGELKNIPERRFITIFGISNDLNYIDVIDPRIKSSSSFVEIVFEPYNAEQIEAILSERVKLAFYPDVLHKDDIYMCASRSAKSDGDARRAIELLRTAGSIANKEGVSSITIDHLDKAVEVLSENKYLKLAESLPLHNKLVLLAVIKLARLPVSKRTSNIVMGTYVEICKYDKEHPLDPLARTTISGFISELKMLGFFKTKQINKGRRGGVTREIEFADKVPVDLLLDTLYSDYTIDGLQDYVPRAYMYQQ